MNNSEITHKLMVERQQLIGFLTMITGDRFAADDLFQETCLEVFRLRHKYRRGSNFGAWCRGIARIQALRYLRGRGKANEVAFSPEVVDALEGSWAETVASPTFSARAAQLRSCLGELPTMHRRVLTMHYAEQLSFADIADRLGKSTASVKMLASRLRRRLRLCIQLKAADSATTPEASPDGR